MLNYVHVYVVIAVEITIHITIQDQKTALHYFSVGGHHDTVRVLLEGGADPNTHDKVSGV